MKVETFSDVLDWTRAVHRNLADCAAHCGAGSRHEKVRMLLDYVHEHETRLNRILESSQKDADPAALNSWAYEFFEKAPVRPHEACAADFKDKDTGEIISAVLAQHNKIIEFYRYMASRAEVPSTQALMTNLLELEQNEARRMARDAGELDDL
ncbi:hypothetical protein [Alloalcanivorax profundimaris]|uniref:hypothetical protein n=1 Tax=Alloalcanivorax profundimaris TaxID=2735259 RepID=UPI00188921BF|nr:hypothetical protein [Alloalcanivorax profundimaris]MBF1802333.1 hypothetical protein [Alloalcanivorax profundimaris]MCQ6260907.1 hypothetical protein [Alcanivorax sp. MM125-6]